MIHIIQLEVEVEDFFGNNKTLTLPCNLNEELPDHYDYSIMLCSPDIPIRTDNVKELNDLLDEINCENPEMTTEYLDALLEGALHWDADDAEFVRRIKENAFMLFDISGEPDDLDSYEEIAARYLATVQKIPFDRKIKEAFLEAAGDGAAQNYIDWFQIWRRYEDMGFVTAERSDPGSKIVRCYIVHIR